MDTIYFESPIGTLKICGSDSGISSVLFVDPEMSRPSKTVSPILMEAQEQLMAYFRKERKDFNLKLNPSGSEFQQRVWNQLLEIPHGRTMTYQQIAILLGDPKVIRAAAAANGKNPIAIIIPCHRVIGSDGSLTGYAGGLSRKQWLLEHESIVTQGKLF